MYRPQRTPPPQGHPWHTLRAGPPAARTATAAEAMVATGGVSRSKLPTTCLLTEDHADLLT